MLSGRALLSVAAALTVITGGAVSAAPVSVSPAAVRVSSGSVSIVQTVDAAGNANYAVTFTGTVGGHGWTYSGTLSGLSQQPFSEYSPNGPWVIPNFPVSSSNGRITGFCGARPGDSLDGVNLIAASSPVAPGSVGPVPQEVFDCVLSRDGGTPWAITLDTLLANSSTDAGATTASGSFRGVEAASSLVAVPSTTFGDVQLTTHYICCGTGSLVFESLVFSGQIDLGSTVYHGDLVSTGTATEGTPGAWTMNPITMSGTGPHEQVTGECSGTLNQSATGLVVSTATDASPDDFTCNLSLNGAAPVTVTLHAYLLGGESRVAPNPDFDSGWSDDSGTFTG